MKQQCYFDNNWMLFLLFDCCIQCRLQWKSMWTIATKLCCNIHHVVHSQYYTVYWLHNNCCHCTIISDMQVHWSACKSVGFCCNFLQDTVSIVAYKCIDQSHVVLAIMFANTTRQIVLLDTEIFSGTCILENVYVSKLHRPASTSHTTASNLHVPVGNLTGTCKTYIIAASDVWCHTAHLWL